MTEINKKNTNNTIKTLSRNKKLALTGALSALDIVLVITNLGFIPIPALSASPTILHIPVILAVMLAGLPEGLFVGGVFGITSLIKAAVMPVSPLDPLFANPICSILPRILIAVVAWGMWKLLNLIPHMAKSINAAITALITTLSHTLLVFGFLFLVFGISGGTGLGQDAMGFLSMGYWGVIVVSLPNIIFECIGAVVISVAVYAGIYIASNRKSKLSKDLD